MILRKVDSPKNTNVYQLILPLIKLPGNELWNQSSVDSLCLSLVSSHFVTIFMSVVCHGLTLSRFFLSHFVSVSLCHDFLSHFVTVSLCHDFVLSVFCHGLTLSRLLIRGLSRSHFVTVFCPWSVIRTVL